MSAVEVPCIKGKCCRPSTSTEFDSTYPTELNGIISSDEFQASIGRINASLQRPKWTFRVQTAGRILILLGIVLLLFSGVKYFRMKHHHHEEHDHDHSNPVAPAASGSPPATQQFPELPIPSSASDQNAASVSVLQQDQIDESSDKEHSQNDGDHKHDKKHGKCIKHIFHSGLVSLIVGIALCRWIAGRKVRQLITRVVPAICAEHHLYTSSARAVPVSWSLDERSVCKYMCKNNALKLLLDLHSLVPLNRIAAKPISNNAAEKQQMMSGSAYVPLNTSEA